MKYKLTILFLFFLFQSLTQNEDVNWYVGSGVGLSFKDCELAVNTNYNNDGYSWEGNVAISDINGDLLFYSNGYNIYNKDHFIMTGGSGAGLSNSITQNLIVPKPGNNEIYYLITADVQAGQVYNVSYPNANGINYAEIDMSLDGGLGQVVSSFNILKATPNCEKLCLIPHQNGIDFWIVGHEFGNNNFFIFEVNNNGINPTPIIQPVGPIIDTPQSGVPGNSNFDAIGELKASPDASRLVYTSYYNGTTCLFDFDNGTGTISNPQQINLSGFGGYGVSFSPDNNKLYLSAVDSSEFSSGIPNSNGSLFQYDLSVNDPVIIEASQYLIMECFDCVFADLKIGPDGRIYVSHYGQSGNNTGDDYIGVINQPNNSTTSINYIHNGVYLEGRSSSWSLNNYIERNYFCDDLGISDFTDGLKKVPIKTIDLLGREIEDKPNTVIIYIYSDGTSEKVFRAE